MSANGELNRILTAVEDNILATSDREIASRTTKDDTSSLRRIIAVQLNEFEEHSSRALPSDTREQRSLLSMIMKNRSVPSELRVAFKSTERLTAAG